MNRRTFSRYASGLFVGSALGATPVDSYNANDAVRRTRARFDAVLFDAFPIFDPRPMARLAEELFPGRGAELISTWRARQFDYAWLRVVAGDYADFWRCTEDALRQWYSFAFRSRTSMSQPVSTRLLPIWWFVRLIAGGHWHIAVAGG